VPAIIVFVVAIVGLLGLVVMSLWNELIPSLFHGPVLGFWQAVGLLVLCRLLFGGFKGHHGHRGWRSRMWRERWESMTPEERAQLRERFRGKCGWAGPQARTAEQPRTEGTSL
jgi:hypothetical protein